MENHGREIDSTLNRDLIKDGRGALDAGTPRVPATTFRPASCIGIGGAPTRATTIPQDAASRKKYPVASGVLDYFPDALAAISHVSWRGNEQHNPGQPLHWARGKSADEADTMMRHFLERGTYDTDGIRHSAKMAWRALALLQKEIENEQSRSLRTTVAPKHDEVMDAQQCAEEARKFLAADAPYARAHTLRREQEEVQDLTPDGRYQS